jgi:hypothetical protein
MPTGLMPGSATQGERANAQLKYWRILRKLRCPLASIGHSRTSSRTRPAAPDEPGRRIRASALARTTSGSRGSAGRSSAQGRSGRSLGLWMRMRLMSPPAAMSESRLQVVLTSFGHCPAQALARRTPGRLRHGPSAFAPPRSPDDRRTPGPPAGRTLRRRTRGRPRRWPSGPDRRRVHRSAGGPTRTTRRPRPRWYWDGMSLAAFSAP